MSRRATAILVPTVIVALLGGAAAFWLLTNKRVTVLVDGSARVVRTHSGTVGSVLGQAGLQVGLHDLLSPQRGAQVRDGSRVILRRGRPVTVEVDGRARQIWVTARSVDELLGQIGYRNANLWLSASRSRPIPLSGLTLALRTAKLASIVADGRSTQLTTTVATVGDLLTVGHVVLAPTDRTSVPLATPVSAGLVVRVTRIRQSVRTVRVSVPQPVVRHPDSGLYAGQTRVLDAGAAGVTVQTWTDTTTDGRVTARKLTGQVVKSKPRPQIVGVGIRARPVAAPVGVVTAPPRSQPAAAPPAPPASSSGLNWAALAGCESGGNPRAYNPAGPYYGLYQFSAGTWASVGGSGLPSSASSSEQTYRASLLYQRSGAGQWPVCGHYLFS